MSEKKPFVIEPASCRRRTQTLMSFFKRDMAPVLEEFTAILKTDVDSNNFDIIQNKIYKIDFLTGCNLKSNNDIDKLKGLLVLDDILVKGPQYNASYYINNLSEDRIKQTSGTNDKVMEKKYRQFRLNLLYVRFALLCNIYLLFSKKSIIETVQIDSVDPEKGWKSVKNEKTKDTTIEDIKKTIEYIKNTRTSLELKPETIATIKNVSNKNDVFNGFLENTFEEDLTIKSTTEGTSGTQIPTTNQQGMYQPFINPSALTRDNRTRRDSPTPPHVNQSQDLYPKQQQLRQIAALTSHINRLETEYTDISGNSDSAKNLREKNRSLSDTLTKRLSEINTGGNKRKTKKRSKNITKNKRKTKNTPLKIINRQRRFNTKVTDK
jgi:hypothetical protein